MDTQEIEILDHLFISKVEVEVPTISVRQQAFPTDTGRVLLNADIVHALLRTGSGVGVGVAAVVGAGAEAVVMPTSVVSAAAFEEEAAPEAVPEKRCPDPVTPDAAFVSRRIRKCRPELSISASPLSVMLASFEFVAETHPSASPAFNHPCIPESLPFRESIL